MYFQYDFLKVEQIECLQQVICLREDVLAVVSTGFGENLIYQTYIKNYIYDLASNLPLQGSPRTRSASPADTSSLQQHLLDFRAQSKARLIQMRILSLESWVAFAFFGSGVDLLGERFPCNRFTDCELLAVLTFTIPSSL